MNRSWITNNRKIWKPNFQKYLRAYSMICLCILSYECVFYFGKSDYNVLSLGMDLRNILKRSQPNPVPAQTNRKKNYNQLARICSPRLLLWFRRHSAYFEDLVDAITTTSPLPEPKKMPLQRNSFLPEPKKTTLPLISQAVQNALSLRTEFSTVSLTQPQIYPFLFVPLWNASFKYRPLWHSCCSCCPTLLDWT